MTEQLDLIESSRASFEEKAYISYIMHCEKHNMSADSRAVLFQRLENGDYYTAHVTSLWIGWKWCYEICKTPVK